MTPRRTINPPPGTPITNRMQTRREFARRVACASLTTLLSGCAAINRNHHEEAIIDIHQHLGYAGRTDEILLDHQQAMGVTRTILLPAGRPIISAVTQQGVANGLQAKCLGNEAAFRFARDHARQFAFGANEVPDLPDATAEIEKYLKLGAVIIGEQKFGIECDSPAMRRIYDLAADYRVPVLMHWQYGMYNFGFERFASVLKQHPRTLFIGHAQTWWAHIDAAYRDDTRNLYPQGPVKPGGWTDRYLSDYANLFGDLSAGSGLNALTRDEDHTRAFLDRHQDKLLYGSDCDDAMGRPPGCQGAATLAVIRRLAPSHSVERKLLCGNARRLFRARV